MSKYILLFSFVFCSLLSPAQTRFLQVEANHSTIGFRIPIAGFSVVTGKFGDYSIDLDWNDEDYSAMTITADIKVASINTGIPDRDEHLQSADFFDAIQFPSITFKSDSIKRIDFSNFEAHGICSMHGVEKRIVLPFKIIKIDGNTIGFQSRYNLNRLDYGIGAEFKHTAMPDFLAEEIEVEIDFWTKKRKMEK